MKTSVRELVVVVLRNARSYLFHIRETCKSESYIHYQGKSTNGTQRALISPSSIGT